jgi:hypothetical protein
MAKAQATDITSRQSATRIGQSTAFGADCAYRSGAPATIRTMPRCSTSCSNGHRTRPSATASWSIIRKSSTASRYPAGRLLGELVFADRGDAGPGIGELQDRVAAAAKACVKSLSGRVLTAPSAGAADCDLHGEAGRRVSLGAALRIDATSPAVTAPA